MPLGAIVAFVFAGLVLLFQIFKPDNPSDLQFQIYGEKNLVGLKTMEKTHLTWGDQEQVPFLLSSMGAMGGKQELIDLSSLLAQKEYRTPDFTLKKLNEKVSLGVFLTAENKTARILFFNESFLAEEWNEVAILGESDFWVMNQNFWPDFLPLPSSGILYLADRTPSAAIKAKANEHQIPLVTYKETEGFYIFEENDSWIVKTRSKTTSPDTASLEE